MPPRDEQDYESRRQQIIDGALEVFSSKGFEQATNKDIAQAASIGSPGLIYHYFKDKADLLQQVLETRAPVLQLIAHADELMDLPPREALQRLAHAYIATMTDPRAVKLFKLVLGESIRRPIVADILNRVGPARGLNFLSRYLEHQMSLGRLRRMDPGAAARCFMGPLLAYIMTREVFPQPDTPHLRPEMMVRTTVDIFLDGIMLEAEPSMVTGSVSKEKPE